MVLAAAQICQNLLDSGREQFPGSKFPALVNQTITQPKEPPLKYTPIIEVARELETPVRVDNEVQRTLRGMLDWWGDDMANWRNDDCGSHLGYGCAINALYGSSSGGMRMDIVNILRAASKQLGFHGITDCSDSGPVNARAMVLRAITLAGES